MSNNSRPTNSGSSILNKVYYERYVVNNVSKALQNHRVKTEKKENNPMCISEN